MALCSGSKGTLDFKRGNIVNCRTHDGGEKRGRGGGGGPRVRKSQKLRNKIGKKQSYKKNLAPYSIISRVIKKRKRQ